MSPRVRYIILLHLERISSIGWKVCVHQRNSKYIIADMMLCFEKHERYNIINLFTKQWCLYSIDTPNEYIRNISHW